MIFDKAPPHYPQARHENTVQARSQESPQFTPTQQSPARSPYGHAIHERNVGRNDDRAQNSSAQRRPRAPVSLLSRSKEIEFINKPSGLCESLSRSLCVHNAMPSYKGTHKQKMGSSENKTLSNLIQPYPSGTDGDAIAQRASYGERIQQDIIGYLDQLEAIEQKSLMIDNPSMIKVIMPLVVALDTDPSATASYLKTWYMYDTVFMNKNLVDHLNERQVELKENNPNHVLDTFHKTPDATRL